MTGVRNGRLAASCMLVNGLLIALHAGDRPASQARLAQAHALATQLRDQPALAAVESVECLMALTRDAPADALTHAQRALDHERQIGDPTAIASALTRVAISAVLCGDLDHARPAVVKPSR